MDRAAFAGLRNSIIIIELHDWFFADGRQRLERLIQASTETHSHKALTMGARDLSPFPELAKLSDDERWLICSEGRGQLMTWLRFDPIQ